MANAGRDNFDAHFAGLRWINFHGLQLQGSLRRPCHRSAARDHLLEQIKFERNYYKKTLIDKFISPFPQFQFYPTFFGGKEVKRREEAENQLFSRVAKREEAWPRNIPVESDREGAWPKPFVKADQSINQPIDTSVKQSTNQSINQPIDMSVKQVIHKEWLEQWILNNPI